MVLLLETKVYYGSDGRTNGGVSRGLAARFVDATEILDELASDGR